MKNISQFANCPICNQSNAKQMTWTWWGGFIGPLLISHVKCQSCGKTYNGKTGKDNTTIIAIYNLIAVLIGILFAALFVFTFFK
jgi:transposase-like protein